MQLSFMRKDRYSVQAVSIHGEKRKGNLYDRKRINNFQASRGYKRGILKASSDCNMDEP